MIKAKEAELESMKRMEVFDIVPMAESKMETDGVWVDCRWVVTNKGTEATPVAKARLVAREFADTKRNDLYAGTPGLSFVKACLSAATAVRDNAPTKKVMTLDVKTAFLYGKARRNIFVTLPHDITCKYKEPVVGRLKRALYGTRDAPMIWSDHLRDTMSSISCEPSDLMPGLFYNRARELLCVAHVDDVLCVGAEVHLNWLRSELEKHYVLKAQITGPEVGDKTSTEFLGRALSWTSCGIAWEGNEKYVRSLLREHGLSSCKPVNTPIVSNTRVQGNQTRVPLEPELATKHRRACATINYVSHDRPDLSVVACELAKTMANPCTGDEALVKRCLRYLRGLPRAIQLYRFRNDYVTRRPCLQLWTDSDWANCPTTRKSNSGGVLCLNGSPIKHWCRTQGKVAASSGEAEVLSANVGLAEMAQVYNTMTQFFGDAWADLQHKVDASACHSLLVKRGACGFKHFDTKDVWGQEIVRKLGVAVTRVPRVQNISDVLASPSSASDFFDHLSRMDFVFVPADCSPEDALDEHILSHSPIGE